MDRDRFLKMPIKDEIHFFNEKLSIGLNISEVCTELKIKNNTLENKFKRHGYIFENGRYVLQQIIGQGDLFQKFEKLESDKKVILPVEKILENEEETDTAIIIESTQHQKNNIIKPLKRGRPPKNNKKHTNLNINKDIKIQLKIYCFKNDVSLSDLVEGWAVEFLKNQNIKIDE